MVRLSKTKSKLPIKELLSLSGKRALVTGSGAGIGRSIAYRLAEAGAELILVDIDETRLRSVEKELLEEEKIVKTLKADLSNKAEIDSVWKNLSREEPDILVNNAGIYPLKNFLEIDEVILDKVLDINLKAVLWMCQGMIRGRGSRGGNIVNVASIEAIVPFKRDLVHYGAAKAGVLSVTRSVAKEYSGKGFRVNAVIPGGILTPGTRGVAKEILKGNIDVAKSGIEFRARLPMGRFGDPDEVARVVLFLASEMSSYVTGSFIVVDGGFLST
jgi:3-oxoacyl-[acyl-carrier protein] reductase